MRRQFTIVAVVLAGALCAAAPSLAQDFALQVGPPVAGNSQPAKKSVFVVRPGGCADPAAARITATAEGIVAGTRRTLPLTLDALPTPGVHAVPREQWVTTGTWVVNLVGTCAGQTAGALVPVGKDGGFRRETVKLLAHRPTPQEIEASLKALVGGGQQ